MKLRTKVRKLYKGPGPELYINFAPHCPLRVPSSPHALHATMHWSPVLFVLCTLEKLVFDWRLEGIIIIRKCCRLRTFLLSVVNCFMHLERILTDEKEERKVNFHSETKTQTYTKTHS